MSHKTFEEIWQEINKLQGTDITTLCRSHNNHIVTVDKTGVFTFPNGSEYAHWVTKGAFKTVWERLITDGEFVPVEDGGYYFACACIAQALPEVNYSYENGVLRLYLSR